MASTSSIKEFSIDHTLHSEISQKNHRKYLSEIYQQKLDKSTTEHIKKFSEKFFNNSSNFHSSKHCHLALQHLYKSYLNQHLNAHVPYHCKGIYKTQLGFHLDYVPTSDKNYKFIVFSNPKLFPATVIKESVFANAKFAVDLETRSTYTVKNLHITTIEYNLEYFKLSTNYSLLVKAIKIEEKIRKKTIPYIFYMGLSNNKLPNWKCSIFYDYNSINARHFQNDFFTSSLNNDLSKYYDKIDDLFVNIFKDTRNAHQSHIVHNNICLENINFEMKQLENWESAIDRSETVTSLPELITICEEDLYSRDVYQMGCTFFHLYFGFQYNSLDQFKTLNQTLFQNITIDLAEDWWIITLPKISALLKRMVNPDFWSRISLLDAQQEFLSIVAWKDLFSYKNV
ncbi:MAG: hypothetical protein JHC93_06900 [Parachlamydiales bacterium]|nr:hypothetical protein [Parachlamydiales bacterium]